MLVFICKIVFTHALRTLYARSAVCLLASYPDSGLRQVCPHGDLLPGAHVRVAVPLESGFQLLQLLAGEVSPLPPLLLLLGVVRVPVIAPVLSTPLLFCGSLKSVELLHVTATFIWLLNKKYFCIQRVNICTLNVKRFRLGDSAAACKGQRLKKAREQEISKVKAINKLFTVLYIKNKPENRSDSLKPNIYKHVSVLHRFFQTHSDLPSVNMRFFTTSSAHPYLPAAILYSRPNKIAPLN